MVEPLHGGVGGAELKKLKQSCPITSSLISRRFGEELLMPSLPNGTLLDCDIDVMALDCIKGIIM
jgi:hypothetical protein